ncbi:MAG: hypothetical protein AAGA56_02825 [Myxococcota bacterium]
MKLVSIAFVSICCAACGPNIMEQRMGNYPPRPDDCNLEVLSQMPPVGVGSEWQVAGTVVLTENGTSDPMSEENRSIVRPRACAMGGEALTINAMVAQQGAFSSHATGTTYFVLRRAAGAKAPPQTF